MKEKIFHPKLQLLVRVVLGGILVYASWHKIADPPDFAKIIYNYSLFPEASLHTFAVFVPWLELVAGLALITGIGLRGGALMAAIFFSFFIVALSYNLARECATICGCFDTHESGKELTDPEKFSKMRREIVLDCSLVVAALYVLVGSLGCCGGGSCDGGSEDAPAPAEESAA
ncbi:MAG: MauE/DoxX family redox-associated membrane protein [Planctomycetota bacterium]|nr:MauE/DoxX family redox-associated membrane protein [Planctomycetota bacterium]